MPHQKTYIIKAEHGFTSLPPAHPLSIQAQGFLDAEKKTPYPPIALKSGATRVYNQPRTCGDWYAEIEFGKNAVSAIGETQHEALQAVAAKAAQS